MMEESSDESAEIITKEEADLARKMQDAEISRKYYRTLNGGNLRTYKHETKPYSYNFCLFRP